MQATYQKGFRPSKVEPITNNIIMHNLSKSALRMYYFTGTWRKRNNPRNIPRL